VIGCNIVPISIYKNRLASVEVIHVEGKVATCVNSAVRKFTLPDVLFRNVSFFILSHIRSIYDLEILAYLHVLNDPEYTIYYGMPSLLCGWMCPSLAPERIHGFHSYAVFKSSIHLYSDTCFPVPIILEVTWCWEPYKDVLERIAHNGLTVLLLTVSARCECKDDGLLEACRVLL
jgi:hypothetical protein